MEHKLSGSQVKRLMRANGKTIRGLASAMNITQTRVRYVRERGVSGPGFVWDWLEAIGAPVPDTVIAAARGMSQGLRQQPAIPQP